MRLSGCPWKHVSVEGRGVGRVLLGISESRSSGKSHAGKVLAEFAWEGQKLRCCEIGRPEDTSDCNLEQLKK